MISGGLDQTLPGALSSPATWDGRHSHVQDDQRESSRDQDLTAAKRLFQVVGAKPEKTLEVGAESQGLLRIEMVAEIDESRRLTGASRRRQNGENE